ncbi:MAG TPA: UbiX family flavin prenyltransferase [Trueperaceae bacterium]|nr:UbiX family flavin prenyltransferase [Trueperaceae bacterium]
MENKLIVGVSGASGTIYALNLLNKLAKLNIQIDLVISTGAKEVIAHELKKEINLEKLASRVYDNKNLGAAIASGSYLARGMVIAPCSSSSLAKIAHGISDNLLTRAASVCLKENRPLILLIREAPYSRPMLKNMLEAKEAGAIIMPASPSFYNNPENIDDLISSVTERILDLLKIKNKSAKRWRDHD